MDTDINLVFDALQNTYQGKRIDEHKVVVRCPICNENNKQHSHSHCYVGLINDNPPLVYHCFMNECSGVVTPQFLRDMGIFDNELDVILNNFNRARMSYSDYAEKKIYMVAKKKENINIPEIEDNSNNEYKLNYLRQRLGVKFSYENAKSLKIIFSLKDFLEENNIEPNRKYGKYLKDLNNDYLGFLTADRSFLVMRNTRQTKGLRYVKYDIFGSMDNKEIVYIVPGTTADLFSDSVDLNIAEGPFDALGIFCHINKYKRENQIYAACCGSGYINAIKYFLRMGFVANLNVNLYSDSDKELSYYRKIGLMKEIRPWVNDITIYYNTLSKDYGVPRAQIELKKAVKRFY